MDRSVLMSFWDIATVCRFINGDIFFDWQRLIKNDSEPAYENS